MNYSTILAANNWNTVAKKNNLKDNGLNRALATYEKLDDNKHDERTKAIVQVIQLANDLQEAKETIAVPALAKYLKDMIAAAESERRDIANAKAEAEKALKAQAEAQKKAGAEAKKRQQEEQKAAQDGDDEEEDEADDEEEEEEIGDSVERLKRALQNLKTSKVPYNFIACDIKPYGLVVSKRKIKSSVQHKKELATIAGGSTRPPKFGTCRREGSKLFFEMEKPTPGLARILQKWLKSNTGILFKVTVGTESAEDEEGEGQPENRPKEERPAPTPALVKAPEVWHQTRRDIETSIVQLKTAVREQFAEEGADLLAEIDRNMQKLDGILGKLDHRLAESLENANAAKDPAARKTELTHAKSLLVDYIKYVKSEPMIAHIDSNPFGVKTNLKRRLADSLAQMAKAIG